MSGSLKSRYFYKLFSNFIGFGISLITGAIIPRGLGPKAYGDFSFLTNFFQQFLNFLNLGTSLGFYTKISQRQRDTGILAFYFWLNIFMFSVSMLFVFLANASRLNNYIWPSQQVYFIFLACVFAILSWSADVFSVMADAFGITIRAEKIKIVQKFIGLAIILFLFFNKKLWLSNYFYYNFFNSAFLLFYLGKIIWDGGYLANIKSALFSIKLKDYAAEFYEYSHPIFICGLVAFLFNILDRWLLQSFGGSIEQGFYALSFQIGSICFLFASTMTPLICREFSIAYAKQDKGAIASLFRRHVPLLYSITAFIACFVAVNADKITLILSGGKFKDATLAVCIMSFYPIHQVYGQVTGTVFYSTNQTKLYRNIGIIFLLIGLPITYFMIAPRSNFGLNAGATGLAIKMVVINIFSVNALLFFIVKFLKLSFWKFIIHQIFVVFVFICFAMGIKWIMSKVFYGGLNIVLDFIISGIIYAILIAGICYWKPIILGFNKGDFKTIFKNMLRGNQNKLAVEAGDRYGKIDC